MEASALHAAAGLTRVSRSARLLRLRSDEQLVALFRQGHERAFDAIHDRYSTRLLAYARQMLSGSQPDAEDAVQDVFMRAHRALRASRKPISLRAWLYRVAHNRCIDQLRRPSPAPTDQLESSLAFGDDALAQTERREDLRRLIVNVRRLPDQQRSALLMRELDGLSYADLAGALDVSVPAIKSLLVRARIGLVEAAEARDAACHDIRAELAIAHGRGVRGSGRARRHMRDCDGCREFRGELRSVRHALALLPAPGGGALAKLLGLGSGGAGAGGAGAASATAGVTSAGGGAASGSVALAIGTKVAAAVAVAVATAGGAAAINHQLSSSWPAAHQAQSAGAHGASAGSGAAASEAHAPYSPAGAGAGAGAGPAGSAAGGPGSTAHAPAAGPAGAAGNTTGTATTAIGAGSQPGAGTQTTGPAGVQGSLNGLLGLLGLGPAPPQTQTGPSSATGSSASGQSTGASNTGSIGAGSASGTS